MNRDDRLFLLPAFLQPVRVLPRKAGPRPHNSGVVRGRFKKEPVGISLEGDVAVGIENFKFIERPFPQAEPVSKKTVPPESVNWRSFFFCSSLKLSGDSAVM